MAEITRKILVAYPHGDDESLGMAGTMAHYADQGVQVVVALLTNGDKGRVNYGDSLREPRNKDEKQALVARRRQESVMSLGLLGVSEIKNWDVPTRELVPSRKYIDRMKALLVQEQPTVVLGFHEAGTTLHQDHIASALIMYIAITELLQANLLPGFLRYLTSTLPQALTMLDKYGEIIVPEKELTKIDVSQQIARKKQAVYSHESQKHIIKALDQNGVLDITHERFFERITRSSSTAQGGNDLFVGANQSAVDYIIRTMPLHESHYMTSDKRVFAERLDFMLSFV